MNIQTLRLYWIGLNHSLILDDRAIMSSYGFVRYSETPHHINFMLFIDSWEKGKFLFIFSRKSYWQSFINYYFWVIKFWITKTILPILRVSLTHVCSISVCQMHEETAEWLHECLLMNFFMKSKSLLQVDFQYCLHGKMFDFFTVY